MKLNFRKYGQGHPLIILHGLLGCSSNWHTIGSALGEDYEVYLPDMRNHGESPHSDEFDYACMATDVIEFMASQGVERPHLLGHSMGGKVAMHCALRFAEKIDRLIVVDIAPRDYSARHAGILDALVAVKPEDHQSRDEFDAALAEHIPQTPVRTFLLKNLERGDSGVYRWKVNLEAIRDNYAHMHEGFPTNVKDEGPVLFIRGGASDYITEDDLVQIGTQFPASTISTVPDAGHWVHLDATEEFLNEVRQFLGVH